MSPARHPFRLRTSSLALCTAIAAMGAWPLGAAHASATGLVISQVYGGGGATSGSPSFNRDYVELFNAGSAPVSLNGLSLQYASSAGNFGSSSSNVKVLGNVTLQPGRYYLIGLSSGSLGTALTGTDDTGSLAMSASAGKIAIVQGTTALNCSTACPAGSFVDLVTYGSGGNLAEGGSAAPGLSNTLAAFRAGQGCTDTDNNGADFATGVPAPRNSGTAAVSCGGGNPPAPVSVTIPQIQGSGSTSPYVGQAVTTQGVVTRINSNGYFIQDPVGDGNAATSDGVFVFTGGAPSGIAVHDLVRVTATVTEYNTGSAANTLTAAHTVTELTSPGTPTVLSSGAAIAPMPIVFPEAQNDDLERVEGMLVSIAGPLTVSQNYFLARYGQLTLGAGGRLLKPTNLYRPLSSDALALAADNARRSLILDDGLSTQNPDPTPYIGLDDTVRAGDTIASLVGVIDYGLATNDADGLADYKLHPTEAPVITRSNARTSTPPAAPAANVKVASFNVLNYFTTIDQAGAACAPGNTRSDCRGADSAEEFARQQAKIVAAITALDADVLGLMEIQNNGNTAAQNLVDALNAVAGAGTYATVPLPAGGTGTDAIRVAMIYKPGKLARVGSPVSDTASIHNRPPLAQTFAAANGEAFTVVVNHFKSKGCDGAAGADLDQGDGQGCFNARRIQQAQALRSFIANLQASTGDADVLVIGDLNAYAKEDPVHQFTSNGFVDLVEAYNGQAGYSYVFDGEAGYLDHALASPSLSAQAVGTFEWHINADEPSGIDYNLEFKQPACPTCGPDLYASTPFRSSDHDPVLVGLQLLKRVQGTASRDTLSGTPGDDVITGAEGADLLSGGSGRDTFAYLSLRDAGDTITDFVPGTDRLALGALLQAIGYTGTQPVSDGVVRLVSTAAGVSVQIDVDGNGGPGVARPLVTLRGVAAAQIDPLRDIAY